MNGVRAVLRAFVLFVLCSAAVPLAVTGTILATFIFAPLPATIPEPKEFAASRISTVLDGNGQEIGVFREFEQNIPIRPEDIPEHLKQAVISSEDQNFYSHGGVDVRGSMRALLADIRNKSVVQGGSTITQQYVKNAYTGQERTVVRKVREAILASQLDRQFEKDDILFKYLSSIYLGDGAYGVGAASETYFRKPVSKLTLSEAALLAGLIPAPSRYEPRGNAVLAEQKRVIVLNNMLEQGRITQQQYDEAIKQRIHLAVKGPAPPGATVVYPPQQQNTKFPYFVDYVGRYLVAKYGPAKVYKGGLRIQTTLDPDIQAAAEKTVADQLKGTKSPLEMSLVAVEPPTGYVKALVGGRDFNQSEVNLALGGCPPKPGPDSRNKVEVAATCWDGESVAGGGTGRQPGSAFKPFVLATAFAKGMAPTKTYPAPAVFRIPGCKGDKCEIGNSEGGGGGSANLRTATVKSINTVYAQLVRDVGCKDTGEMAKKLGIESAWYSPQFHTCSGTYALGVIDVSPLNMASAYGVFANRGVRVAPTPVLKVVDGDGKVLEDNTKPKGDRVIEEVVADNVTDAMKGVIGPGGTAGRAQIGRPAAGKTGTGQNYTNAWFVGYTPTLSTAVWMGYSTDQKTPLLRIRGHSRVFGGTIPAQTWGDFMKAALKDVPATEFNEPAPIKPLADALERQRRDGFDPGPKRNADGTGDGGPYMVTPPPPTATAPTTTTTAPVDDGSGDGDGDGDEDEDEEEPPDDDPIFGPP